MKKTLIAIVLGLGIVFAHGQDRGIYAQYHLYPILINPGLTGYHDQHELLFNFRNTWSTFPGAPFSYTFSYNGSVVDRVGLGAMIFSEEIGSLNRFRGLISYAYNFESENFKMGIGLTTEYQQYKLDNESIISPFYDLGDDLAEEAVAGVKFFDVTFGAYGEVQDQFFFGLSFPNLVRARIDKPNLDTPDDNSAFTYFLALVGYRFDVTAYNFVVEPSILVKRLREAPFQADINLKLSFIEEQLIGGLTYSLGNSDKVGFLIGTRIDKLRLSYSYDIGLVDFQDFNNGSHEISVGLTFGAKQSDTPETPEE